MNRICSLLVVRATLLAVLLALLTTLSVTSATPAGASRADNYVAQARAATNVARTDRRIRGLRYNKCLQKAARAQAERMARSRSISHSPDFSQIGPRCNLSTWGENVAKAVGADQGRGVVRQWMGSSGHRANILNRGYRAVGIGAVRAGGSWWVVQVFGRRF